MQKSPEVDAWFAASEHPRRDVMLQVREAILAAVDVEPLTTELAKLAGEALAAVQHATLVDAVVMASAALRGGGVVYTADADDLVRLQRHVPTVLVVPV